MPTAKITVKADAILKKAQSTFDARVKTAAKDRLARIDSSTKAIVEKVGAALQAHFDKQDAAGITPYPDYDNYNGVHGVRLTLDDKALGAALAAKLVAVDGNSQEQGAVQTAVANAIGDEGFNVEVESLSPLTVFISDPEFSVDN